MKREVLVMDLEGRRGDHIVAFNSRFSASYLGWAEVCTLNKIWRRDRHPLAAPPGGQGLRDNTRWAFI